jgi:hypothetical protein
VVSLSFLLLLSALLRPIDHAVVWLLFFFSCFLQLLPVLISPSNSPSSINPLFSLAYEVHISLGRPYSRLLEGLLEDNISRGIVVSLKTPVSSFSSLRICTILIDSPSCFPYTSEHEADLVRKKFYRYILFSHRHGSVPSFPRGAHSSAPRCKNGRSRTSQFGKLRECDNGGYWKVRAPRQRHDNLVPHPRSSGRSADSLAFPPRPLSFAVAGGGLGCPSNDARSLVPGAGLQRTIYFCQWSRSAFESQ